MADNTNLYVFGGYNPDYEESGGPENEDYPLFRELWRYHFATGSWQQIRTEGYMPTELASMSGESPGCEAVGGRSSSPVTRCVMCLCFCRWMWTGRSPYIRAALTMMSRHQQCLCSLSYVLHRE